MNRFRNAVIAVVTAFCATFGVLTFFAHRASVALYQRGGHDKLPPEGAWIYALIDTVIIFAVIAAIGLIVAILHSIWKFFRSRRHRLP